MLTHGRGQPQDFQYPPRSSKSYPCPICGDKDGSCSTLQNGSWACYDGENHKDVPSGRWKYSQPLLNGMGASFIFDDGSAQIPKSSWQNYIYSDDQGNPYHRVARNNQKKFSQSHWNGHDWVSGLPKSFKRIPYRLPDLIGAETVVIVEGEKDVHSAIDTGLEQRLGVVFTTNPEGADKWPSGWGKKYLAGKRVLVIPDNDSEGKKHAQKVLDDVKPWATSAQLLELPGLAEKGDLTDYLALNGQALDIGTLISNALLAPVEPPNTSLLAASSYDHSDEKPSKMAEHFKRVKELFGKQLRFNEFSKVVELNGVPLSIDEFQVFLAVNHNLQVPDNQISKILVSVAKENSYHPIREYLNSVADKYGSSTDKLESLAEIYLGTSDPLHQQYLRKTLIGAVARIYEPGCQLDTVLILQGAQGIGKSSFFRTLASSDWFDDSFGNASDKDERLKLLQSWFCEWAELETVFRRRDVSQLKAFLTSRYDLIRPPYGRQTERFPRTVVFIGTTNEQEFLSDPTGSRRYWVIPCSDVGINIALLAEERDAIWAAAVSAYRNRKEWWLSKEEEAERARQAEAYQQSDAWEEPIEDYLRLATTGVTIREILQNALKFEDGQITRAHEMRVGNILKGMGYKSRQTKVSGKKLRLWFKKEAH